MKEKKIFISEDGREFTTKKEAVAHDNICYLQSQGVTEYEFDEFVNTTKNTHVQAIVMRFGNDWRNWEQRFILNAIAEFKDMRDDIVTYNLYYAKTRWDKSRKWATSTKCPKTAGVPKEFTDYISSMSNPYYTYDIVKTDEDDDFTFTLEENRVEPYVLLERNIELEEQDIKRLLWDYEELYEEEGYEGRWDKDMTTIVQVPTGDMYEISWAKGLTEMQEHQFDNQPRKVKKFEIVTKMVPVKEMIIEYEEDDEKADEVHYPVPDID